MDAASNLALINATVWSQTDPDVQEIHWKRDKERMSALAKQGTLKLFSAEVRELDLQGGTFTAYRVENAFPGVASGYDQPRLLIAPAGERTPAEVFRGIRRQAPLDSELLKFDGHWYLFGFSVVHSRFVVSDLSRPVPGMFGPGPLVMHSTCVIQHVSDWKAGSPRWR